MSKRCAPCEPPYYPSSLDEEWTCPDCGSHYTALDPAALPEVYRSKATGLGWDSGLYGRMEA